MRYRKYVISSILVLLIIPLVSGAVLSEVLLSGNGGISGKSGTVVSTELINFYSMSTSEVHQFVDILHEQGIPMFIVRLNAMSEFRTGTSSGIAKATEVINYANSLGMQVSIDLHTWYTTWDSYFDDSANLNLRPEYVSYVVNVLTSFKDVNVYSFMVLNEPQAQRASVGENNFILEVIAAAHQSTARPVSVRFMCGYSPSTGYYSPAIDEASDYLCRNTYWDSRYPTQSKYGSTESNVLGSVSAAHALGKELWISEFGATNENLENQRSYVEAFVAYSKSHDMDRIFCWVSQPDQSGESYNIFNGYTPLPAFRELVQ